MSQQLNTNVGIGGLDRGLCMIPSSATELFELNKHESGLKEATIRFACFDPGPLEPTRGTKCTDFLSGNAETRAVLALFPYMACQSSNIRVNGEGNGIHGVDVKCRAQFSITPFRPQRSLRSRLRTGANI
jgi:hypothetical protein